MYYEGNACSDRNLCNWQVKYSLRYIVREMGARAVKRRVLQREFVAPWDWRRGKPLLGA